MPQFRGEGKTAKAKKPPKALIPKSNRNLVAKDKRDSVALSLDYPSPDDFLGDLDGIEGGTFAQIISDDPKP